MNIQTRYPTTPDEFLRWNEGREGRREFVKGRVVEMIINVTENHYRLAARLVVQLAGQLGDDDYIVGSADFGVSTRDGVRFPDVMVHRPGDGRRLATKTPLLIAEILSASSMTDDFGPKAADYLALGSLEHYLIFAQNEAHARVWSRDVERAWHKPVLHDDVSKPLALPGLGVSIDLERLFSGIVTAQKSVVDNDQ